jgi:type II secretory pathway pseudopilin PulG
MAIIGILAAILIPTMSSVREKAWQSTCASNLRNWGMAINTYATENKGAYHISNGTVFQPWPLAGAGANNPCFTYFKTTRTLDDLLPCPSIPDETFAAFGPNTPDRTCYVIVRATHKTSPRPSPPCPTAARPPPPARCS